MKALLTGGTGFLGKRVLCELVDQGMFVRCAVRPTSNVAALKEFVGGDRWQRVEVVTARLSDPDDCRELVQDRHVVYHCAAALGGAPSQLVLNTVVPTRTLITAAAQCAVDRFVLVSSLGVYGPQSLQSGATLDESCPLDARPWERDAYTYSKHLQEEIATDLAGRYLLPLVIVRPGVIFGDERGVLSDRVGLRMGRWVLRMGGRRRIPLTYVSNCARAVARAGTAGGLFADGSPVAINVVDDDLPSGARVLRRCRRAGMTLRTVPVPQFLVRTLARFNEWYSRRTDYHLPMVLSRHRVDAMWKPLQFSNARARRLLNWTPFVDFETALQRTFSTEDRARV